MSTLGRRVGGDLVRRRGLAAVFLPGPVAPLDPQWARVKSRSPLVWLLRVLLVALGNTLGAGVAHASIAEPRAVVTSAAEPAASLERAWLAADAAVDVAAEAPPAPPERSGEPESRPDSEPDPEDDRDDGLTDAAPAPASPELVHPPARRATVPHVPSGPLQPSFHTLDRPPRG